MRADEERLAAAAKQGLGMLKEEVDEEDIAEVVSKWTHIPVSRLMEGEIQKLVQMETRLHQRVIGQEVAISDWITITQEQVNQFAQATGDHQWIHVDVERAAAGLFGGTIAHGYLTLSLLPVLGSEIFSLDTPGAKLNYGVNKVRFPAPVRVGRRIRAHARVAGVTDLPTGAVIVWTMALIALLAHLVTAGSARTTVIGATFDDQSRSPP